VIRDGRPESFSHELPFFSHELKRKVLGERRCAIPIQCDGKLVAPDPIPKAGRVPKAEFFNQA
jgi:hypothetical protein